MTWLWLPAFLVAWFFGGLAFALLWGALVRLGRNYNG